ncbi:MAG TPA: polyprenyl synthetase family protein [Saprospiraceae bacterium]|nr:polyprenyl synthetase family protein [Saprospiraceae bacterium]
MEFIQRYHDAIEQYIQTSLPAGPPLSLYQPIQYLMSIGGKRIRPALTLLACEMYSQNHQPALAAAYALEIFHNFTLMHDDIMDQAAVRRGQATVHQKYDVNTAILSGDVMLIHCYQVLSSYGPKSTEILHCFNQMAVQLCEGQRMDMDFETTEQVSIKDYLTMIEYKTSVLLACALQTGAIIADADEGEQKHLYAFGINSGIAFQIQDDLLDAFGDAAMVGKQAGGDIIQGKKTYLYLKALELADAKQKESLLGYYQAGAMADPQEKVEAVKKIFVDTGAKEYALQVRDAYNDLAKSHIKALTVNDDHKKHLYVLADFMAARKM